MNAENAIEPKDRIQTPKVEHSPLWNRVLICSTLFFLMGCANAKKEESSSAQAPQVPTAVSPTAPVPTTLPAKADTPVNVDAQAKSLTCKRDADVRVLEIEALQPKGCKLWYNRLGSKSSVASSEKSTTHCETVLARMQKSLEVVQFRCTLGSVSQDASSKSMTPSKPATASVTSTTTTSSSTTTTTTTVVTPTTTTLKK